MTLSKPRAATVALIVILVVALGLRLINLGFGLPNLYDPDEPIFMITALKLLKDGTFNPGWFGHPGSTTIYLLAIIDVVTVVVGLVSGRFADVHQFAAAAYADPALLFLPSRLAMVLIAVACVYLTYRVGRSLFGQPTGLVAAALLALNPLHIAWSQVVRTDIHASLFMLASLLFTLRLARTGRLRDYLVAGALVGVAMATKWPSATGFVAVIGACAYRISTDREHARRQLGLLGLAGVAVIVGLFLASPFIFLDWHTVLSNLGGEVKTGHLGHSSLGRLANLDYYVIGQVGGSMGLLGLALAAFGLGLTTFHHRLAAWILVPLSLVTLALICSQAVIWSRWVLPLLPMVCLFAALSVTTLAAWLGDRVPRLGRRAAVALFAILALVPSVAGAWDGMRERDNDTRDQAAAWAVAHIPPGSSLVLEHLALGLRTRPWHIKFPIGAAGCLDAVNLLRANVQYKDVQKMRHESPIVDLGNVAQDKVASCRSDFALLVYYDLYLDEAARYPNEVETYRRVLAGGKTVALFRPAPGVASGPVVRILAMPRSS